MSDLIWPRPDSERDRSRARFVQQFKAIFGDVDGHNLAWAILDQIGLEDYDHEHRYHHVRKADSRSGHTTQGGEQAPVDGTATPQAVGP